LIKKEVIAGYENLEIDIYKDIGLDKKQIYGLNPACMI
jgi:hypothetical protein